MRALITGLAMLVAAASANADELCDKTAKVAREVMKARQNGVPIDDMMQVAARQKEGFDALTKQLVLRAYEIDRRFSPAAQEREIVEFGNQSYLACTKAQ